MITDGNFNMKTPFVTLQRQLIQLDGYGTPGFGPDAESHMESFVRTHGNVVLSGFQMALGCLVVCG